MLLCYYCVYYLEGSICIPPDPAPMSFLVRLMAWKKTEIGGQQKRKIKENKNKKIKQRIGGQQMCLPGGA